MAQTLTQTLLSNPATAPSYTRATQARFLQLGGQGRLPRAELARWLAQDRHYACAYARFIGALIARVQLPAHVALASAEQVHRGSTDMAGTATWRVFEVLCQALAGIRTELEFFGRTAGLYGLDGAEMTGPVEMVDATRRYVDLFDTFTAGSERWGSKGCSGENEDEQRIEVLMEGLILLWATERVYLDAWTYALEQGKERGAAKLEEDLDGGALRKEFIPNWTSSGFQAFVHEIQKCVDRYAQVCGASNVNEMGLEVWKKVLELEEAFWPVV